MVQQPNELAEVARLLVQNSTAESYRFHVILGLLALAIMAVGAVVVGFFREQGKLIASNVAFKTALNHLVQQTEQTESIRLRLGHSDWTEKELRTLRRTKLEELVTALSKATLTLESWITSEELAGGAERRSAEPMAIVEQISVMYFPELAAERSELLQAYLSFQQWRLVHQREITQADIAFKAANSIVTYFRDHPPHDPQMAIAAVTDLQQKAQELGQKRQEMTDQYGLQYKPFLAATHKLRQKAAELMTTIIKPVAYEPRPTD